MKFRDGDLVRFFQSGSITPFHGVVARTSKATIAVLCDGVVVLVDRRMVSHPEKRLFSVR